MIYNQDTMCLLKRNPVFDSKDSVLSSLGKCCCCINIFHVVQGKKSHSAKLFLHKRHAVLLRHYNSKYFFLSAIS